MVTTVITKLKNFNLSLLREDLASAPITSWSFAGFNRLPDERRTPKATATVVGVTVANGVRVEDTAEPGEIRFYSETEPTQEQIDALNAILDAHDSAQDSLEQQRKVLDEADWQALLDGRPAYLANIQNWDAMTSADKLVAAKEMFALIGRALRVLYRDRKGGDL